MPRHRRLKDTKYASEFTTAGSFEDAERQVKEVWSHATPWLPIEGYERTIHHWALTYAGAYNLVARWEEASKQLWIRHRVGQDPKGLVK